ncbi:glycerophosphodiester phosphodiesterase family protein [Mammaliicoccus stepanovicii]|uniref:Glycerophosphoryl diester phosphodiesterase n=1 Tax=Mammaliicoccus stepanovicii TaxID=643214 RepID=A0A239YC47_9STAP|nr:glycerophosphodiester phosphodiesterase family protein [Mammaliicoccus stepanovicii]PNZ75541.1 glycerophosphoryl diester phosphodiesterase [Mammaliicoccus stepanovicii]GGI42627.1 glycerophosphoryl diester phosphodiesterase [Mammaliicoccus stepanovicii]SNV56719.1 glycerophosphoryl diester phosphodiesterase [Mammaliicoccus stepanovicii]
MKTIFAHRGIPDLAPENTLRSFKEVIKHPEVKWLELDVAITADKELVIIHDDFYDRTTNISGEVSNSQFNQLNNIDAGFWFDASFKNEKLPTLWDVIHFANCHKINLNLELKGVTGENGYALSITFIKLLQEYIQKFNKDIDIIISSFNFTLLKLAQQYIPHIKRAVLFEMHAFYPDWRTIAEYCGSNIIHLEDKNLTKALIHEIKSSGYILNIYTVNTCDRANELFNWGVDGIFTDKCHKLKYILE